MVKHTITILFFLFFLDFTHVNAAELSFNVQEIKPGFPIIVDVMLNTEGESVNSGEIKMSFPDSLKFSGHDISKSSILIWLKKPQIDLDGTIIFSGIIPGGIERVYDPENPDFRAITLARLLFEPKDVSINGEFNIEEALILKNDGKGTAVPISDIPKTISFEANNNFSSEDSISPQSFTIEVIESSIFARTPRLAMFGTTDEGSGIERYEVKRGLMKYKTASSPYPLPYKLWTYKFHVRAIDYAGNTREESIIVTGNKPLFLGAIVVVLFGGYLFYNYRMKRRQAL